MTDPRFEHDWSEGRDEREDPLGTVKGILLGCAAGAVIWAALWLSWWALS